MMILRTVRRSGALAALLALVLQAFWPLLAQARPADPVLQVPLCSVDGVTHNVEIKIDKSTPLDKRAASHGDHCKFCVFGDGKAVLNVVVVHSVFSSWAKSRKVANPKSSFQEQFQLRSARPRAPPQAS